jgi:hypothetical protein
MNRAFLRPALLAVLLTLPAAAEAVPVIRWHCANGLAYASMTDDATRSVTVRRAGYCSWEPYTVTVDVVDDGAGTGRDHNLYEAQAYRSITDPDWRAARAFEPSPRFRREIDRAEVRGAITVSRDQLPNSVARAVPRD